MKGRFIAASWLIAGMAAFAQPPAFDVASVKLAAPPPVFSGSTPPPPPPPGGVIGDRMTWSNMSLKSLIGVAYGVKDYQIAGPDWMASTRFDISAKLPAGATAAQAPAMLQRLLQERFKLVTTHEQRDLPVYALVIAKSGSKLKEADAASHSLRIEPKPGARRLIGQAAMPLVATILSLQLDRPVLDMTGLRGTYQIDATWAPSENERNYSPDESSAASIFTAFEETLGLKLDPRKAPADVLVVTHAERTPSAN